MNLAKKYIEGKRNYYLQETRLVKDYFLENLNEEGYFGRKATFYRLITDVLKEVFLTHTHTVFSRPYPLTPDYRR